MLTDEQIRIAKEEMEQAIARGEEKPRTWSISFLLAAFTELQERRSAPGVTLSESEAEFVIAYLRQSGIRADAERAERIKTKLRDQLQAMRARGGEWGRWLGFPTQQVGIGLPSWRLSGINCCWRSKH